MLIASGPRGEGNATLSGPRGGGQCHAQQCKGRRGNAMLSGPMAEGDATLSGRGAGVLFTGGAGKRPTLACVLQAEVLLVHR